MSEERMNSLFIHTLSLLVWFRMDVDAVDCIPRMNEKISRIRLNECWSGNGMNLYFRWDFWQDVQK